MEDIRSDSIQLLELTRLAVELDEIKTEKKEIEKKEKKTLASLRLILEKHDLPVTKDKSQYFDLPYDNKVLRVTRGEPTPTLDSKILLDLIKDPALFLRVISIKTIDLNEVEWRKALEEELVFNSMLAAAMNESKEKSLTISIAPKTKDAMISEQNE